jgi:hypothetical protein
VEALIEPWSTFEWSRFSNVDLDEVDRPDTSLPMLNEKPRWISERRSWYRYILSLRLNLPVQIGRMYSVGDSVSEVLLASPEWWTPTAEAKAIVGLVLSI